MIGVLVHDAFFSALASLGFALLFSAPRRTLPGCLVCGAAGHATRTLAMQVGVSIEVATLAGAVVVGFLGVAFARRWQVPAPIFHICGAIPLVPGVFAYRAMIGIVTVASATPETGGAILVNATINAIKTALILVAIAGGIAAPTLLFQRRKPVV